MSVIDVKQSKDRLAIMCLEIIPPKVWKIRGIAKKLGLNITVTTKIITEPLEENKSVIVKADGTNYVNEKNLKKSRIIMVSIEGDMLKFSKEIKKLGVI